MKLKDMKKVIDMPVKKYHQTLEYDKDGLPAKLTSEVYYEKG
tara:strand:- start:1783 stop:1908 length:126 start_codon:yes stop_codon:yes gene_type:complete